MAVCVKTLEGKSEMVPVPAGATVIDLVRHMHTRHSLCAPHRSLCPCFGWIMLQQRAAAAILEPEKEFEHHAWLLLHKGKQQPDAAPLRSLPEYSDDMVFHLVALQPGTRNGSNPVAWQSGRHVLNASLYCLVSSSLSADAGAADAAADGDDEWSVIGEFPFYVGVQTRLARRFTNHQRVDHVGGGTGFHHDAKAHSLAVSSDSQTCSGHKWGSALLRTRSGSGFQRGKHCWAFKVRLRRTLPLPPPYSVCLGWTMWVQVVNKAQSGGVCIGVALQRFDATRKNVGAAPNSWGYSSSGKKVLSPSL